MNKKPALDDLKLFCDVVRHRSFAATSRELGLSKAAVSKRIALLESAVNGKLLHRTTRHVSLTGLGEIVHPWAQRILDDVNLMGEALSQEKAEPEGQLRICSSTGFGRNRLSPALSALAARYPGLQIHVELLDRTVNLIEEGFQLDVRVGQVNESHVIKRRITGNRRILCASPDYLARFGRPERLEDLARHRCLAIRERDRDFGRWELVGPDGTETIRINGPLSANNGEVIREWAIDGHGVILRSEWDVENAIREGRLIHVLPQFHQEADVWAVYPSSLSVSAKTRACVEFLVDWFGRSESKEIAEEA